jgi:cysteine-rich repeat protein
LTVDCTAYDDQCNLGMCDPADGSCYAAPTNEGGACDNGDLCTAYGAACDAGACIGGTPVDCSSFDGVCAVGTCDPADGSCYAAPVSEGYPCDDGDPCTLVDVCEGGLCQDSEGADWIFFEDFDNNNQGWTLDTDWGISSAVASSGCYPGADPGVDHTSTADNGIAGVIIGGCTTSTLHGDYCLTSPVFDGTELAAVSLTYWRSLNTDYDPYQHHHIDVWNGSTWTTIYTTGSSSVADTAWTYFQYSLTPYINAAMQIRWCYNVMSAGAYTAPSWSIDDVTIGPPGCSHEAVDTCGDGTVDPGEECDDGNGSNADACLDDCTWAS